MMAFCSWCSKELVTGKMHKCSKRPVWMRRSEKRAKELERRSP